MQLSNALKTPLAQALGMMLIAAAIGIIISFVIPTFGAVHITMAGISAGLTAYGIFKCMPHFESARIMHQEASSQKGVRQ